MKLYHYDHLGSTKAVTDKDGNIVAEFSYGTYGELLTDKTEYSNLPETRFLYNGQLIAITYTLVIKKGHSCLLVAEKIQINNYA